MAALLGVYGHVRARDAYRGSREMRDLDRTAGLHEQAVADVQDAAVALARCRIVRREAEQARADVVGRHRAERATVAARYAFERESVERRLAEALESVEQRMAVLENSGTREELVALRQLQDRALRDGMAQFPLPAEMLGDRLTATMRRAGVETAADFTRITAAVPTSPELRGQAAVTLSRPGPTLRVDDVTPALARALQKWRDEIVEDLRMRLPATLPYREAQELHRRRADRRIDLARQAARARERALAELEALDAGIDAARHAARQQAAAQTGLADTDLRAASSAVDAAERTAADAAARVDRLTRDLTGYRKLTYARFLRDLLSGH